MKRKHPYQILSILLLCLIITVVISLGVGAVYISPAEIFQQIVGSSQGSSFILTNYRIPRTLIAIVVGAALAVAGAICRGY